MVRILVVASFNMDLVMRAEQPRPGETLQGDFAMYLGGKGFNQAIAARRLGADVAAVGCVGDDEFGRAFLAALDREGIDCRGVRTDREAGTGVASITVLPDGDNAIVQAPRANLRLAPIDVEDLDVVDCVLATLETPGAVAAAVQQRLREEVPRARFILNAAPASRLAGVPRSPWDIIVANAIEAETFTGIQIDGLASASEAAALAVRRDHIGAMVITRGAEGAVAVSEGQRIRVEPHTVRVVDSTGAGDAFCAALAVRLAEGADLQSAGRFASAAGALACTRHGAEPSMPARAEVEALLAASA